MSNAKYWVGVLYPESMIDDWKDTIGDVLQVAYAYCLHDKCVDEKGERRKPHIHLILAFNNTTTYNHALETLNGLTDENKGSTGTIKKIMNLRHMYDYLIHDTDDCRKKGKHLYAPEERICGNGFDIGFMEQLSLEDKERMAEEIADVISDYGISNFMVLRDYVVEHMAPEYRTVLRSYSGYLEKLTKANYQLAVSNLNKKGAGENDNF